MQLIIKHFNELTTQELFKIYQLRTSVFVVEQNCPYQEVDEADLVSYHVYLEENDEILAYARVIPSNITFPTCSIGRVIAKKRRCGLGTKIVKAAIEVAKEKFQADIITIEAQVYASEMYKKIGFVQTSDVFLEDNIPHIQMKYDTLKKSL